MKNRLCTGGPAAIELCFLRNLWRPGQYLKLQPFTEDDAQPLDAPDDIPCGSHVNVHGTVIPDMLYRGW